VTDLPDEETIRVRRTWSRPAGADPADNPAVEPGPDPIPTDTMPSETESDIVGPIRRRSTYVDGTENLDPPTDDGSTIIARRETRRRAAREHASEQDGSWPAGLPRTPPPLPDRPAAVVAGRVAAAPDAAAGAVYSARAATPVVASRSAPSPHPPQAPIDGDTAASARRHRTRRLTLIVVTAASAVALAAAASLILILFTEG